MGDIDGVEKGGFEGSDVHTGLVFCRSCAICSATSSGLIVSMKNMAVAVESVVSMVRPFNTTGLGRLQAAVDRLPLLQQRRRLLQASCHSALCLWW